ncbi:MAG: hypothetical protein Q9168_000101 [Polycauliona sp. 1 TL-2023]
MIWDMSLGLVRCNSTIGAEAAAVFYGNNIFRIHSDDWDYRLVVHWLKQIGRQNRSYLRRLEMRIWVPRKAWQQPNGIRTNGRDDNRLHPHLAAPSLPCPAGKVDVVDPLVENIIALVSQSRGRKLKLCLKLGPTDFNVVPGSIGPSTVGPSTAGPSEKANRRDQGDEAWLSMDLPNLIEKWRAGYTSNDRLRIVDVLWTVTTDKSFFLNARKSIEYLGWQIVNEPTEYELTDPAPSTIPIVLKRRKLTTTPAAEHPYIL